jgi:hypothetical protein
MEEVISLNHMRLGLLLLMMIALAASSALSGDLPGSGDQDHVRQSERPLDGYVIHDALDSAGGMVSSESYAMMYTMGELAVGLSFNSACRLWSGFAPFPRILVDVAEGTKPIARTRLYNAVPNPFNPRTLIAYDISTPCDVRLAIYDVTGREVVTLFSGHRDRGSHLAEWNGMTSAGRAAASGVYFLRMEAGGLAETKRLVMGK